MITYSRYYYYKKELDFAVKVEKNVYFDTNLSAYDSFRENTENLSPSQLLINFFKFYSDTSRNYSKFAIDISDPNGPFVSKEDYFKKLQDQLSGTQEGRYLIETINRGIDEEWAFTVIDPFDCTYNPAKHVKKDRFIHREYLT